MACTNKLHKETVNPNFVLQTVKCIIVSDVNLTATCF